MNSLHYFDKSYVPVSRIETTRVAVVLVAESKATTYLKNKFLTQSLLSTTPLMQYKKHFEVRLRMFEFFFCESTCYSNLSKIAPCKILDPR